MLLHEAIFFVDMTLKHVIVLFRVTSTRNNDVVYFGAYFGTERGCLDVNCLFNPSGLRCRRKGMHSWLYS